MLGGYTGKILRINLTTGAISSLDSARYQEYGGGLGMGAAVFWDLAVAPGEWDMRSAFDPRNVIALMGTPFAGTMTPTASGKCNVVSLGPHGYPTEWFTRSNIGGRLGGEMKNAGWDGIVVEGRAEHPVWINIVNDQVTIEDAKGIWGKDTYVAQQKIWRMVTGLGGGEGWNETTAKSATTQKPAVICIGQAGENLARNSILLHDAGHACGQGGFGAVFGSKNLKAISILGSGYGAKIADPKAFMETRLWYRDNFQYDVDNPRTECPEPSGTNLGQSNPNFAGASPPVEMWGLGSHQPGFMALGSMQHEPSRPAACQGCPTACRRRTESSRGNDGMCASLALPAVWGAQEQDVGEISDAAHRYGVNMFEIGYCHGLYVFSLLRQKGVVGPGKQVDTGDLPLDQYGKVEFPLAVIRAIALRTPGFGDTAAEGMARAATKWGRYQEDTATGLLPLAYWGWWYHYEPRVDTDYAYGSLFGDREINEFNFLIPMHWMNVVHQMFGKDPFVTAEEAVNIIASKVGPAQYRGDPMMFNYNDAYSDHVVKRIAWGRHYSCFWLHSLNFCTIQFPNWYDQNNPVNKLGATPEAELRFYNAVTGANIGIEESDRLGRKVWNLVRAILIMQGRHRDMEYHADYVYDVPTVHPNYKSVYEDGEWKWSDNIGKKLDREKFDDFKTRYYEFEGWDPRSGWPRRSTLEELGLGHVADVLEAKGKLGAAVQAIDELQPA